MKSKNLNFEYIEDLVYHITEKIENGKVLFVTVVGKFDEIKDMIKELITTKEVDFESLDIQSPTINGYEDEFVLDIWHHDDTIQIGCEPIKRNGNYIDFCGDETYVLDNCSSKVVPLCESMNTYYVSVDDDYDCCNDCENYDECCCDNCCNDEIFTKNSDENDDIYGFTVDKSDDKGYCKITYYTGNKMDKKKTFILYLKLLVLVSFYFSEEF